MPAGRVLSPLDAAFLWFERDAQPMNVGCVAVLDGPIPHDALVATVMERLGADRRWRQRPVRALLDWRLPTWEDAPRFDARHHVRRVAVPAPGGEAELRALASSLFATPLDPALPLWDMTLLEGLADGRSAMLFRIHHCMIDGVSGAQVLDLITDLEDGGSAPPLPPGGRTATRSLLGRLWDTGRHAVGLASTMAEVLLEPATPLPFTGPLSPARELVWASFPLEEILALRGAAGCKVNDVVLAIISGALRDELQARGAAVDATRVRALVPVSARPDTERTSLGNLVSAIFPVLPVQVSDPVARLRTVQADVQARRERGEAQATGLLLDLMGRMPAPFEALLGRVMPDGALFSTVCTNVPGPRGRRTLLGRRVLDVHPIAPLFQQMGCEFAILSQGDRISITACVDPALVPDAGRFAHALQHAFETLRSALGVALPPAVEAADGTPRVASLMTATVLALGPEDSLATAWLAMRRARIRHLPVQSADGRLVGIITHRDLMAFASSRLAVPSEEERIRQLAGLRVGEVMETHVQSVRPDEAAAAAGARLLRGKIGCLPVVDDGGRLVGIVTAADFLRWATARLREEPGTGRVHAA